MSAHTLTSISSIAAGTSNAAGGVTVGSIIDLGAPGSTSAPDGGTIYLRLTNGSTGPTAACEMVVFESTVVGASAPTAPTSAADANWKQVHAFGGGTTANDVTHSRYSFGPGVRYLVAMMRANTGQAVTGEALGQAFAY